MEWKNRTLRSMLKGNKEKVLFLFCSGLLLFVISLPDSGKTDPGWNNRAAEVLADVGDESAEDPSAGSETAAKAESVSYEAELERRIRELLRSVGGCGSGVKKVYNKFDTAGKEDITWKLYDNDRHEILNETDRDVVYHDILAWMNVHLA